MALKPQKFDPRQQMRHPDFELQYKRDTDLRNVELHHHDFFEIYFLISGDVTYTIDGQLYHILPGDLLLISPKELHKVQIEPEHHYERYVLWIDQGMLRALSSDETDLGHGLDPVRENYCNQLRLTTEEQAMVRQIVEKLYREVTEGGFGSVLLQRSLLVQLLVFINRQATSRPVEEELPETSSLVSQVVRYISTHYGEPLSLDQLSERFYVSRSHLSHEFHRQTGTSVYRYIQKKRLLIARQRLSQGEKPNQVYASCGFGDYTSFYRAFKQEYGSSPSAYMKMIR